MMPAVGVLKEPSRMEQAVKPIEPGIEHEHREAKRDNRIYDRHLMDLVAPSGLIVEPCPQSERE